jgi:magnesium transporter
VLLAYRNEPSGISVEAIEAHAAITPMAGLLWLDLLNPSPAEEACVERCIGINAMTSTERAALEESARFYEENDALVLTATVTMQVPDTNQIQADAITFILKEGLLATVRDIKPRAFEIGHGRASARIDRAQNGADVFLALIESLIERVADRLSASGRQANAQAQRIFNSGSKGPSLTCELQEIGQIGANVAMCHESAASLQRLAAFAEQAHARHDLPQDRLRAFRKDVEQLERQAEALQNTLNFQLDAMLGITSASQNNVLKTLSVATMAFVPPTLVASIFGMNFDAMHWFHAPWGPWAAAGIMIGSVAVVFSFARWHRWL